MAIKYIYLHCHGVRRSLTDFTGIFRISSGSKFKHIDIANPAGTKHRSFIPEHLIFSPFKNSTEAVVESQLKRANLTATPKYSLTP